MIDKLTVDKIYEAAHIVDVVSDFVTLKKRGVNYVGLCPFHEDSSPSFYVSPAKNICKCFACGEGGTSVQFIMKHEQMSYNEALRYLAKKFNIEIRERELTDEEKQSKGERESMMIVNNWAQSHFTSRLYKHEEGKTTGMSYFRERGFRDDIIRKFQLGYSLNKRDDLYKTALENGFNETYLLKTGLVYKRDDGVVFDRFCGRVIFPVQTLSGKIVAFGGRILGKKEKVAKYVNSPESEIYHKSNELYGIFFAKQSIVKADKCYLVEGYIDVISMHQAGIENVVASSGTSLTNGQIRLIHRFTNNITVLYDGDIAGIKAAIRGIDMFLEEGMNVKVVLLPDGEDPDSFSRSRNSFDFNLFIKEHEVDFIRFKANLLLKDAADDPIRKAAMIRNIIESVAVIPDSIIRSVYIKECSFLFEEREEILINEISRIRLQRPAKSSYLTVPTQVAAVKTEDADNNIETQRPENAEKQLVKTEQIIGSKTKNKTFPFKKYEALLVRYIIKHGEKTLFKEVTTSEDGSETVSETTVAQYIKSELDNDDIELQTPLYKRILEEAVANSGNKNFVAKQYFLANCDNEISRLAADMISSKYQLSKYFIAPENNTGIKKDEKERKKSKERETLERQIIHEIFTLKYAYINHRIKELNKKIKEDSDNEDKCRVLMKERIDLDIIKRLLSKELGERIVTGMG
ncbi:MAG: DNA primase [Tannerella sp.]|jgi:DNA primase|nr:DNA primase [Tannerella sp.]